MLQTKQIISLTLDLPKLYPEQSQLVNAFDSNPKIRYVVGAAGTKSGKALHISTLIPTPYGWKTMGDLKAGDYVFDENGKPTKVEFVTDWMFGHKCYEIVFSDGNKVIADADHLWLTKNHATRKSEGRYKGINQRQNFPSILCTEQIKDTLLHYNSKKSRPNHSIDNCQPLQYEKKILELDPYVLGTWLGDGTSNCGDISGIDEEIFIAVASAGFNCCSKVNNLQTRKANGLVYLLRKMNLLNNKHIPQIYLQGSIDQRLSLLQGLMDTDGTTSKKGRCTFYNTNKNLADGVEELCVSLGLKVTRTGKIGKIKGEPKKYCYQINFTTDLPVFKLTRKLQRLRRVAGKSKKRYITEINEVPSVPVKCIRVDSPSHLYLCGKGCIPTHNTFGAAHRMIQQAMNNKNSLNWWVAPTYEQSDMAAKLIMDMLPKQLYTVVRKPVTSITLRDPSGAARSEIVFKSAQHEESLRGFPVNFIVADEMARISEAAYSAFNTTTTRTRGKILYISTPKGHNLFYDLYQKGNKARLGPNEKDPYPQFFSMNLSTYYNPFIPPEDIDEMKHTFTEVMFRQEVLAQFLTDASQVFGNYKKCIGGQLEEPKPGVTYIAGVDLAKTHDYSVVSVFNTQTNQLVHFDRFNNLSWTIQRERIKNIVRKYNNALTVVDSNSIGEPNVEELVKDGLIIYPFYINSNQIKRELIERLIVSIEQNTISYPEIPELLRELEDYELTQNSKGVVSYSAPQGKFDDTIISIALANFFLSHSKQQVYKTTFVRGI